MTTVSLSWERVNCTQRNGDIRGYRIIVESGPYSTIFADITGTGDEERSITLYMFHLAAVTVDGVAGANLSFDITMLPVEGRNRCS